MSFTSRPADISHAKSTALATNLVVKASPGHLHKIWGYNSKGSAQFIQVHDASSLPANAAVPIITMTVAATSNFELDLSDTPVKCSTGITLCNSSSNATKFIGSADVWFNATYK